MRRCIKTFGLYFVCMCLGLSSQNSHLSVSMQVSTQLPTVGGRDTLVSDGKSTVYHYGLNARLRSTFGTFYNLCHMSGVELATDVQ